MSGVFIVPSSMQPPVKKAVEDPATCVKRGRTALAISVRMMQRKA
jgi:hypothetical protein